MAPVQLPWGLRTMAYEISIWLLPVLIAVTFHEAAQDLSPMFSATTPRGGWEGSVSIR